MTLFPGAATEYISAEAKQKKHARAMQFRNIIAQTISSRCGTPSPQKKSIAGIAMNAECIAMSVRLEPSAPSSLPKSRYPAMLPAMPKVATVCTVLTPWESVCLRYTSVSGCTRNATIATNIMYIENDERQLLAAASLIGANIPPPCLAAGGRSRKQTNAARANCSTAQTAMRICRSHTGGCSPIALAAK